MDAHTRDGLVIGFEGLIDALELPDPGDRHVLAAAIHSRADVIVTDNLPHFPPEQLSRYGIEAQHPDEFLTHLIDLAPGPGCAAARTHRLRLKKAPKDRHGIFGNPGASVPFTIRGASERIRTAAVTLFENPRP